jgi:hypothetical protein
MKKSVLVVTPRLNDRVYYQHLERFSYWHGWNPVTHVWPKRLTWHSYISFLLDKDWIDERPPNLITDHRLAFKYLNKHTIPCRIQLSKDDLIYLGFLAEQFDLNVSFTTNPERVVGNLVGQFLEAVAAGYIKEVTESDEPKSAGD